MKKKASSAVRTATKKTATKKTAKNSRPWLAYYKEDNIPEHLEYPDCSMVDMIMQTAEKYPDKVAYSY